MGATQPSVEIHAFYTIAKEEREKYVMIERENVTEESDDAMGLGAMISNMLEAWNQREITT